MLSLLLPPLRSQTNGALQSVSSSPCLTPTKAIAEGRIRRGTKLVLSGFGAGLTWGTAVMRW